MAESLFVAEMGETAEGDRIPSVWAFRDHLTFLDLVMPRRTATWGLASRRSLATGAGGLHRSRA